MKCKFNGTMSLVAIALWVAGTSPMAGAQPVRDTPAGRVVTVPERVLVYLEDGRVEVVTSDILLKAGADAASFVPKRVPVFEVDQDGILSAGLLGRNKSGHPVSSVAFESPDAIRWNREQGYVVEMESILRHSIQGQLSDGYTWKVRDHLEVFLTPEDRGFQKKLAGANVEGPFSLRLNVDEVSFQAALTEADFDDMMISVGLVEFRFGELLRHSVGAVTIDLLAGPLPPDVAARSTVEFRGFSLSSVKSTLINVAQAHQEDAREVQMYNNIPANNLKFSFEEGTVLLANGIFVTSAVGQHLLIVTAPAQDGEIIFSTTLVAPVDSWDYNPEDGPLGANSEDFEGSLTHEVMHILGFTSMGDVGQPPAEAIMAWDMFRFAETLGPSIDAGEVATATRPINTTVPAIYATRMFNSGYVYKGSNIADTQFSHWRDFGLLIPSVPIGIMDPVASQAVFVGLTRYFTSADLRALDIIGWNLEPSNFITDPAEPIEQNDPPQGSYLTSVTPNFTWGPDPQNDTWHVTIFEGSVPDPSATVLAPRDLTTQSYTVPASTPLSDATTYTWVVTGETFAGYAYSEYRTFTVCYADCDQSTGPGVLDVFDFLCFQNAFVASDPYACDCDTSTGPGVCDIFDFLCFQDKTVAGCP